MHACNVSIFRYLYLDSNPDKNGNDKTTTDSVNRNYAYFRLNIIFIRPTNIYGKCILCVQHLSFCEPAINLKFQTKLISLINEISIFTSLWIQVDDQ